MSTNFTEPNVEITSQFWNTYRQLVVDEVLPYQWEVMDDTKDFTVPDDPSGNTFEQSKSYAVRNMRIAAGLEEGEHYGFPFQDSDLYKWLEAAAYTLHYHENEQLKQTADALLEIMAKAQEEDGYLDTAFQIHSKYPKFSLLQRSHELYSMGHYIEAGIAYYQATGNQLALEIATRMADCIDKHFGEDEGKIHGVDGHPEIEIALPKLYQITGEQRYLDLASFFVHERGKNPEFFEQQNAKVRDSSEFMEVMNTFPRSYYQIDKPFIEQTEAQGHAVRVVYLCAGAAHIATLTGDKQLQQAVERLWNNIVNKRMYITGQIGSTHVGESFTFDYDLPNTTMYGESCASVAMSFFARRMMELEPQGKFADVLEKELFNGAISGMSLDGTHFYYVNPLEADPVASRKNPDRKHVLTHRAEWFGCACCPTNIARLIASVDQYIYTVEPDRIISHQFIANRAKFAHGVVVEQTNNFPWDGHVEYHIANPEGCQFAFALRIPSWSSAQWALYVDDKRVDLPVQQGLVTVEIAPSQHSVTLALDLDMSVKSMVASSHIREDVGKVALMRGPVVFCAEQADNQNDLWEYKVEALDAMNQAQNVFEPALLGGVETITIPASVVQHTDATQDESSPYVVVSQEPQMQQTTMKLVPYYRWANRDEGQMSVWLNRA